MGDNDVTLFTFDLGINLAFLTFERAEWDDADALVAAHPVGLPLGRAGEEVPLVLQAVETNQAQTSSGTHGQLHLREINYLTQPYFNRSETLYSPAIP